MKRDSTMQHRLRRNRLRRNSAYGALLSLAVAACFPACTQESSNQPFQPVESVGSDSSAGGTLGQSAAGGSPSAPGMTPAQTAMPTSTAMGGALSSTNMDTVLPAANSAGAGVGGAGGQQTEPMDATAAVGGAPTLTDTSAAGAPTDTMPTIDDMMADAGEMMPEDLGMGGMGGGPGVPELPDPGSEGDGDYEIGPNYSSQPELGNQGAPQGRTFRFTMPISESEIFNGQDSTLDPGKVNQNRSISVYVPAQYQDGTAAPVLVIQDGDGPLGMVSRALDNLTTSNDPNRSLPPFVAVAVQNGGSDAPGSERGLEYDTMSDRYARFIDEEVLPRVASDQQLRQAYPNFKFTTNPSGRGALGCSSGGAAAFTMAWFRPDLFSRVVGYSPTLVDQQDPDAPENAMYPDGAWDYHSELELIANSEKKPIRVFLSAVENDLGANDPESTMHNWVMANERTAEDLAAKGYHYRYVYGLGVGHCDGSFQQATLADALVWVWRGYQPTDE